MVGSKIPSRLLLLAAVPMETGERREETHPQPLLKMSSLSSTPGHHIYSHKKQGLAIPLGCISLSETIRPTHCSFLIPGNSGEGHANHPIAKAEPQNSGKVKQFPANSAAYASPQFGSREAPAETPDFLTVKGAGLYLQCLDINKYGPFPNSVCVPPVSLDRGSEETFPLIPVTKQVSSVGEIRCTWLCNS